MNKGQVDENELSSKDYWDSVLKNAKLPRINSYKHYYPTMNFFHSVLGEENKRTFMEIGSGSSGWLPYFAKRYGYVVSGLDYSEVGCRIAIENLKILNVNFDEIVCEDIFKWTSDKKYDIIFSYGVVEHFDHPERVLEIIYKHLEESGIIITLVPNLTGLMGKLSRIFVLDIYNMHKVISLDGLEKMHLRVGFQKIKTNYVGTFSLGVIPWERSKTFLFRQGSFHRKLVLLFIDVLSRCCHFLLRTFHIEIPTKLLSPYIISIMRKNKIH